MRAVSELKLYEGNPKTHPESQLKLIEKSIQEFGWTTPVLLDRHDVVIAGHGRIEAAQRLGMDRVPTIRLDDLTPDQVRAYRIADNRLTELGPWDTESLVGELEALNLAGFDIDVTGFDLGEVRGQIAETDQFQPEGEPGDRLDEVKPITCPECGHEFNRS